MNGIGKAIDDALWGPESPARLEWTRRALVLLIGIRIAIGPYRRLSGLPDALFEPVPILVWLPSMPPAVVIGLVQVVGVMAVIAAFAPRWRRFTRVAFAIAWLSYLVLAGLFGSRGKVMHNDLLLLWASAPFLLAPVVTKPGDVAPRRETGWPVRVSIVITALVYLFAGYHKLRRSGPAWVFGENMEWVMLWGPAYGAPGWRAVTDWVGSNGIAARVAAAFILGVELAFPLVIWHRWLRPWFTIAAVVLHAGTWVLLGLDYWGWALTVPIVLVDWPALWASHRERRAFAEQGAAS